MASLTPSHIIQYLYCPRFTFFEYVLAIPQYEEKHYKVRKGRNLHEQKLEQNKQYLRKKIGAVDKHLDQYLTNQLLRGQIDEVLELQDGTMTPLDYKFAEYKGKVYNTYQTQLYCYAWLIEENFNREVKRGYIVYTRSGHKLIEVPVERKHIDQVKQCAEDIVDIIETNRFPRATKYKKRCLNCTYNNICIQ